MKFTGQIPQWAIDALKANYRARGRGQMADLWFWLDEIMLESGYEYI